MSTGIFQQGTEDEGEADAQVNIYGLYEAVSIWQGCAGPHHESGHGQDGGHSCRGKSKCDFEQNNISIDLQSVYFKKKVFCSQVLNAIPMLSLTVMFVEVIITHLAQDLSISFIFVIILRISCSTYLSLHLYLDQIQTSGSLTLNLKDWEQNMLNLCFALQDVKIFFTVV